MSGDDGFEDFEFVFPSRDEGFDDEAVGGDVAGHGEVEAVEVALDVEHGEEVGPYGGGQGGFGRRIVELNGWWRVADTGG